MPWRCSTDEAGGSTPEVSLDERRRSTGKCNGEGTRVNRPLPVGDSVLEVFEDVDDVYLGRSDRLAQKLCELIVHWRIDRQYAERDALVV